MGAEEEDESPGQGVSPSLFPRPSIAVIKAPEDVKRIEQENGTAQHGGKDTTSEKEGEGENKSASGNTITVTGIVDSQGDATSSTPILADGASTTSTALVPAAQHFHSRERRNSFTPNLGGTLAGTPGAGTSTMTNLTPLAQQQRNSLFLSQQMINQQNRPSVALQLPDHMNAAS
ncbi:unnamed protein product, partial [Amoebophrya sp. A120]|eukprot:GSA120T00022146001.1